MKKNKSDIIKLNILTIILSLICISCTVNKTNPKESTKNLEVLDSPEKKNQEPKVSKLEKLARNWKLKKEKDSAKNRLQLIPQYLIYWVL